MLEIEVKSITEYGISQGVFRERLGRGVRPLSSVGTRISQSLRSFEMTGWWRKIPLSPPLCKGGRYESGVERENPP